MRLYRLYAIRAGSPSHIDDIVAEEDEEAIALAVIRLERQNLELRCDGRLIARVGRGGVVTRWPETVTHVPPLLRAARARTKRADDGFAFMANKEPYNEPSEVEADEGAVIVDGPDGVAVTLTPEAAAETSHRLLSGAADAAGQRRMKELARDDEESRRGAPSD